jgi:hypothetical protein
MSWYCDSENIEGFEVAEIMGIKFNDAILPAVAEIVRRSGERMGGGHSYAAANKIKIAMKAPENRKIADRVIFQIGSKHRDAILQPAKRADSGEGQAHSDKTTTSKKYLQSLIRG